jgi:hypothetical protein
MIFYLTSDMLPERNSPDTVAPPVVRLSDTVEANSITPPSVSLKSKYTLGYSLISYTIIWMK